MVGGVASSACEAQTDANRGDVISRAEADDAADSASPADGPNVNEPHAPPYSAEVAWESAPSEGGIVEVDSIAVTATALEDAVSVSLRVWSNADGVRHQVETGVVDLQPGGSHAFKISNSDLGISDQLRYSAMIEGHAFITHEGRTRTMYIEPIYAHVEEQSGALLIYGETALVEDFGAGDFGGEDVQVADEEIDKNGSKVVSVGVASVEVLEPDEDTELE